MYVTVTTRPLLQAAQQAQKLREARKEKADMEGNVNDMERAQDFLKAGNVKVLSPTPSHPFSSSLPLIVSDKVAHRLWLKQLYSLTAVLQQLVLERLAHDGVLGLISGKLISHFMAITCGSIPGVLTTRSHFPSYIAACAQLLHNCAFFMNLGHNFGRWQYISTLAISSRTVSYSLT